jgi:hypothetical protein
MYINVSSINLSPTPLRRGEGLKYTWFSTKNQAFEASLLVGERFGEGFLNPSNSRYINFAKKITPSLRNLTSPK